MQLTSLVKTLSMSDLAKHSPELWLSWVRAPEVIREIGSMLLVLGGLILCLLVVFPCMFLMTVGAHSLLWLFAQA